MITLQAIEAGSGEAYRPKHWHRDANDAEAENKCLWLDLHRGEYHDLLLELSRLRAIFEFD
jgi:hypothetical protein